MTTDSKMFIKCRCGHTWMESNPEIERNIVVTSNTIDEIRYTVNYKCEKCGRSESASLYVQ